MNFSETSGQALPAGTCLEEFVIERVLGTGGFGITYLARDSRLGRQVVIKENLPVQFCYRDTRALTVAPRHTHADDLDNFQWSLDNFAKEATMLASLDHPGIVKVLRSFQAFGTAYFVMPFVEGCPLDELLKERGGSPFSEKELRGLLEQVLDALGYLHERGIYHRDIKPANILITDDMAPILIDFGSARQRLSERSMTVIESRGYTPFEQLQSRGNVGPWSDLYALAATTVKVMTGEAPPKANDRSFGDPWQALAGQTELADRFTVGFLSCLDRALCLPVEQRWQDARDWMASLVEMPVKAGRSVTPPHLSPQPDKFDVMLPLTWQAAAAEGDVLAMALLGDTLCWGGFAAAGISRDVPVGVKLVKKSAEQKHPLGLFVLSQIQRVLSVYRTHPDQAQRTEREAVEHGFLTEGNSGGPVWWSSQASYFLNKKPGFRKGKKAIELLERSIDSGYLDAWYAYGQCFLRGKGVRRDRVEGLKWLLNAAKGGCSFAMNEVARCYLNGTGVKKSKTEAFRWFQIAADSGDDDALNSLGYWSREGFMRKRNTTEAVRYYFLAAEAGNPRGMYNFGHCLENGIGVEKNLQKAVDWYEKAHALGHQKAKEGLRRLR